MTYFSDIRIFLCMTPTKMSYSFDSLMGQAEKIFDQNPLSGHLFLFLNRDRDRIKILFWDQDGFCIGYKRLEAGTFQLPSVIAVAARSARSTGTSCRRSAMSTTCPTKRRFVRAVADGWTARSIESHGASRSGRHRWVLPARRSVVPST